MGDPAGIDRFLPDYDVIERHWVLVRSDPEHAFEVLRNLDLTRSLPTKLLFGIRTLPHLLSGRGVSRSPGLDAFIANGFVLLDERPPKEVVLGAVGKFWRPTSGIERITKQEFIPFEQPGYAKGAIDFRIEPTEAGCVVSTETRVRCTDERARRMFRRYWLLIGPFSSYIRRIFLHEIKKAAER